MEIFASADFPRAVMFLATGLWLAIAVFNNIVDRGTNVFLLGIMFSMNLLKEDPDLGNGIKHRAIDSKSFHSGVLTFVVIAQIAIVILLLIASANYWASWLDAPFVDARGMGNLAMIAFVGLWLFFMSGGLWFGYWMKQSHVQQVHMTLVLFSIGMLVLVNLPDA